MKTYGYIYLTRNLINGNCYIGQHKYHRFDLTYYGSGDSIIAAIKKYGSTNFINGIIEWCNTMEELNEREVYWIAFHDTYKHGYNRTIGGRGSSGMKHSVEEIESLRERNLGENNFFFGKHHTLETKERLSKMQTEPEQKAYLRKINLGRLNPMHADNGRSHPKGMLGKHHKRIICNICGKSITKSTHKIHMNTHRINKKIGN